MESDREINPRAILTRIRNTKRGLRTRSRIIALLSRKGGMSTSQIAKEIGLSESCVRKHLRNMVAEGIVMVVKTRRTFWKLTGAGQTSIDDLQS